MAVDDFNSLRVDLQDIFNNAILQTAYISRRIEDDEHWNKYIITAKDFDLVSSFMIEASGLIADAGNYTTSTSQTGLEAITNVFTDSNPNPFDEEDLLDLMESMKQTGEYLAKGEMDTLSFNVTQMEGINPLKYTITQSNIRSAMIHYILYKWCQLNALLTDMKLNWDEFEKFIGKIESGAIANLKTKRAKRPYRIIG